MRKKILGVFILLILIGNEVNFMTIEAKTGAELLLEYQFITGEGEDLMVDKVLTRAEVSVILAELKGVKEEAEHYAVPCTFYDVSCDAWYSPYISYGQANAFLGGYPDGGFRPNAPVSTQEFAAFMMNTLGYNGDYNYEDVLAFSESKKIAIGSKKDYLLRGDAFEVMWQVVNQPPKGFDMPLGVMLGKLENSDSAREMKLDAYSPVSEVLDVGTQALEVRFKSNMEKVDQISFELKSQMGSFDIGTLWNQERTAVKLFFGSKLPSDKYELMVIDRRTESPVTYGPYYAVTEPEKIDEVVFDSETIITSDDYTGSVRYKVLNQYGADITNSLKGEALIFTTSNTACEVNVDYKNEIITISYNVSAQNKNTLKYYSPINIIIEDPNSEFKYNKWFDVY